ncbi:MAG: NADH-quinone oxidoreductase subunit N [Nitrospira sp.]|nr:NADH-quinone oxidoreductase subunit N [bacterium]MBL7048516.1 NADH-quinone oxidoreductase subunit N [Nitrospira sp.]
MNTEVGISLRDAIPFIPELVIICTGLIAMMLDLVVRKKGPVAAFVVFGTLVAGYAMCKLNGFNEPQSAFLNMFILDGYAGFFKLIFFINLILTVCISYRYMIIEKSSYGEYYSLLTFATAGMMVMASATDLITLYLGLELMALSTYILAGLMRNDRRSNEAALKYFFLGAFSSAFLLYGISLTYGMTGTTNLNEISATIQNLNIAGNPILFLGLIFIMTAFAFKIALAPFHMWAPDVYEGAPTSVTAFMSVGPKAAGFAVLGRVLFEAFGSMQVQWTNILIPLALLTMAVGSIVALSQTNIKRMLAYSSVAHASYMLLGVIAGTPAGLVSTINYLLIYTFMNIGAFAIVILLRSEGFQGQDLDDYRGLAKSNPLAAALMLVFMFSLTGIPPTAGFIGKFYVFMELINADKTYLAVIAVAFSAISAFFYLRVVMYMYMKDSDEPRTISCSPSMNVALAVTALMVIVLGIYPEPVLNYVKTVVFG